MTRPISSRRRSVLATPALLYCFLSTTNLLLSSFCPSTWTTGPSVLLLPLVVDASGCPAYTIADHASRMEILNQTDKFFPAALKEIVRHYQRADANDNAATNATATGNKNHTNSTTTILTGVYDCHDEKKGNEVGYAAVCDGNNCTCVAMYNFNVCQSCHLACHNDDGGARGDVVRATKALSTRTNMNLTITALRLTAVTYGAASRTNARSGAALSRAAASSGRVPRLIPSAQRHPTTTQRLR
jgi:hypothetical protein